MKNLNFDSGIVRVWFRYCYGVQLGYTQSLINRVNQTQPELTSIISVSFRFLVQLIQQISLKWKSNSRLVSSKEATFLQTNSSNFDITCTLKSVIILQQNLAKIIPFNTASFGHLICGSIIWL
ncbi:Hypothetical_protein [Hexamita inflata]|uniref:Hypothetical_protein n=1 Tax=Hexamita inflata TaxID=28002 RepID=A0AA86TZE0_9EUKA|nr:Hypothetical protein HINF_LOCUS13668 [Hexamita inflata]CAI9962616.1 Hypothetical protein HINF_LOCUS50261 [Hexamita inflata]